jgi:hypothetical protein
MNLGNAHFVSLYFIIILQSKVQNTLQKEKLFRTLGVFRGFKDL